MGFNRWLIILLVIGNVLLIRFYSPILPHIQVPAEHVAGPFNLPVFGELYLTNTIVAALIGDLLLLGLAFVTWRAVRRGDSILSGLAGVVEIMMEAIYNLVESTAGKHARRIFPWVATIILVVLVANWLELIPGVDSVGLLHEVHGDAEGYEAEELFRLGDMPVSTIVKGGGAEDSSDDHGHLYGVIPFVRVASTDLNFTAAIALVSVVMTQVIGVRALGMGYFRKFFAFSGFAKLWVREQLGPFDVIMPLLDIFVGILELIAEIAKVLSFSFRLFGNIFAGSILLFVIGSLVPVFVQSGVILFELFVGVIQALVFGMLTLVFMTMATQGHDHDEEHGAEH